MNFIVKYQITEVMQWPNNGEGRFVRYAVVEFSLIQEAASESNGAQFTVIIWLHEGDAENGGRGVRTEGKFAVEI